MSELNKETETKYDYAVRLGRGRPRGAHCPSLLGPAAALTGDAHPGALRRVSQGRTCDSPQELAVLHLTLVSAGAKTPPRTIRGATSTSHLAGS
jgi:hypothetical protein